MLVDHLFQCRISPWPKTAEKRGFCTGVTDRRTDRPTDGRTDKPSYRDARTHLKRISSKQIQEKNQRFCATTREKVLREWSANPVNRT